MASILQNPITGIQRFQLTCFPDTSKLKPVTQVNTAAESYVGPSNLVLELGAKWKSRVTCKL